MTTEYDYFPNSLAASVAASDLIEAASVAAIGDKGFFTLVLAGGATPRHLYQRLSAAPVRERLDWRKVHVFWGDERCVGAEQPESNYGMARRLLLDTLSLPASHVHRIPADQDPPEMVARAYEEELRRFFAPYPALMDGGFPTFDLILLGMGADGHTASLFPGSPLLEEKKLWVAAIPKLAGVPGVPRITLTLPVLNRARTVIVLTAGDEKKAIIREIGGDQDAVAGRYPAARLRAARQFWLHAD